MRLVITEAGVAVVVGAVTYIPNHITKAITAALVGGTFLAYSAKEFGYYHSEKHLFYRELETREPPIDQGEQ